MASNGDTPVILAVDDDLASLDQLTPEDVRCRREGGAEAADAAPPRGVS